MINILPAVDSYLNDLHLEKQFDSDLMEELIQEEDRIRLFSS